MKKKGPRHYEINQRKITIVYHLYVRKLKEAKLIEPETRMVVTRGWDGEMVRYWLESTNFQLEDD